MAKQIKQGEDARKALCAGIDQLDLFSHNESLLLSERNR